MKRPKKPTPTEPARAIAIRQRPPPSAASQNPDTPAAHLDPTARTTPNRFSPIERKVILQLVAMCVLAYAGTFAVRFCFYCFHMTSGVV